MKKRNKLSLVAGSLLISGGIISQLNSEADGFVSSIIVTAGAIMVVFGLYRHVKWGEKPERDERSDKVAFTALAASFQMTFFTILILWWANYFNSLSFSTSTVLEILFFVMIFFQLGFRFYYQKTLD